MIHLDMMIQKETIMISIGRHRIEGEPPPLEGGVRETNFTDIWLPRRLPVFSFGVKIHIYFINFCSLQKNR